MKPAARTALGALRDHKAELENRSLRDLFAGDANRFSTFSLTVDTLTLDFSKNRITAETLGLLGALAEAGQVEPLREALFAGEAINTTENRAVMHMALRAQPGDGMMVAGEDVSQEVAAVLSAMKQFTDGVRSGEIAAANGARFTDVVNIGIGGSDLGPAMAAAALTPYRGDGPGLHFVS
ncbi:MAG: glucose-6-phosphate isomerase, partial [Alphaproteobacteria bacterium]